MRALLSKYTGRLADVFLPVAIVADIGIISYGVAMIYLPAGLITGGVLLMLCVIDARR